MAPAAVAYATTATGRQPTLAGRRDQDHRPERHLRGRPGGRSPRSRGTSRGRL